MFNKIYSFLKENIKEIIFFLALFILFSIRFPYYIDSPGGTLSLKKRFEIEESHEINGDISLVYVAERPATIPSLVLSLFFKDWDILPREEVALSNETDEDVNNRGKLSLDQSLNTAILYAFKKAGKEVEIKSTQVFVIYVLEDAKTDLKVGDQIIEINGKKIENRKDIVSIVEALEVGSKLEIKVLANNKELEKSAEISLSDDKKMIGIATETIYEFETEQKVNYEKNKSEMGSSGGFANTLYIYASLIDEDIIKGKKIVATGTIDEDGNVGEIGGVKYKLAAASKAKADIFFVPDNNCEEATELKKEKKYNTNIVCIKNFDDAINYLKGEE